MKHSIAVLLTFIALAAPPTVASAMSFDLPRLDFPTSQPDTTRACGPFQTLTATGGCTAPRR